MLGLFALGIQGWRSDESLEGFEELGHVLTRMPPTATPGHFVFQQALGDLQPHFHGERLAIRLCDGLEGLGAIDLQAVSACGNVNLQKAILGTAQE